MYLALFKCIQLIKLWFVLKIQKSFLLFRKCKQYNTLVRKGTTVYRIQIPFSNYNTQFQFRVLFDLLVILSITDNSINGSYFCMFLRKWGYKLYYDKTKCTNLLTHIHHLEQILRFSFSLLKYNGFYSSFTLLSLSDVEKI